VPIGDAPTPGCDSSGAIRNRDPGYQRFMSSPPGARQADREARVSAVPSHLAFVTSTPLSVAGGSGTYVGIRELARFLEDRQVRVTTHAPRVRLPSYTLQRLVFNLAVARRLRAGDQDWVVGFDLDGFHYGRRPTAPYVASIKGVIADELRNERGLVRVMLAVQAVWERQAVRRARVVVATSAYSRDRIVEAYGISGAKVVIVPEPIDLGGWEAHHGEFPGDEATPPAVLTVAHMYPRKNVAVLLRACARLRAGGVPFQGWIVGDGPCRRAWERLRDDLGLRGTVEFLGTVSRRALADRYRRAAVFCLPSRQEGFGIVFLEAMAHGKPIVAARAAAVPETVPDGEVGLLADPNDAEAFADSLAALLGDRDLRRRMGAAGRRRVETYRADRVAGLFLETVQGALASGTRVAPGTAPAGQSAS
jgi:glycosyltransferase involved in cell wall biosynthesis